MPNPAARAQLRVGLVDWLVAAGRIRQALRELERAGAEADDPGIAPAAAVGRARRAGR